MFEDFGFGVGNGFAGAEKFQMGGSNSRDDGDVRAHKAHQRANFAEMIHADFEDAVTGFARKRGDAEGDTPVVVVGGGRSVGFAQSAKC